MTFRDLLYKKRCGTSRALFLDGLIPQREVAIRIVTATIKRTTTSRLSLNDIATVCWARNAHALELNVTTLWIVTAGSELPKPPLLNDQIRITFWTLLIERSVRFSSS